MPLGTRRYVIWQNAAQFNSVPISGSHKNISNVHNLSMAEGPDTGHVAWNKGEHTFRMVMKQAV
jgi:hypothetical protein